MRALYLEEEKSLCALHYLEEEESSCALHYLKEEESLYLEEEEYKTQEYQQLSSG